MSELAAEFEPSDQTIRSWIKKADVEDGLRSDGTTAAEQEELRELRKDATPPRDSERDILAKATAWFARETDAVPPKSSASQGAHQAEFPIATMRERAGHLHQRLLCVAQTRVI